MDARIKTDRLVLRRVQPFDLEDLHMLVSDYEVVNMTANWPWPADISFTKSRCTPYPRDKGMVGVVFRGAELVGMMGVNVGSDGPGLGYMFAQAHWGNGYATEIGHALIAHVFATYDWSSVSAGVFSDNPASIRVLEKLGFREAAPSMGNSAARGGQFPMRNFVLERPKP
ncbi:MAG: GNAT family N-acetyltransferase [Rhodobacteraceae bacterium]|nr:GNAT family N-acetyltransferase [Paracoccaceae bacterium]